MSINKSMLLLSLVLTYSTTDVTIACSRFTYAAAENTVITGRSMDWDEDIKTDLWAFPAGIARKGDLSSNAVQWTSKYGSVIASGYNLGTADGLNSKGLTANLLYLATADYGKPQSNRKNLSVLNWAQYVLDNYATVNEAVNGLRNVQFNMSAPALPNGASTSLHLAVTDSSGDNAIFEHINGKLIIHHGKEYKVMTNEPTYDKQLALTDYWKRLNGQFLPGTSEPDDRFVRASYYLTTAPSTSDLQHAVSIVFSIIRNVSAPIGQNTPGKPNVASTIWRCVADLKNGVYFLKIRIDLMFFGLTYKN
ncbi:linear amide C-N hydrolase [Legionella tunisiensis]|uniref:linear amide C-N hydrolase n=1 Tax=Legionella tunisiensis TaxID=1034944 RepID=UPI00030B0A1A|nr:linear amide C-N hydrolase [Legionella tunisiensis]